MIVSRTPFRISFFGGGTDYPDWYTKHGGSVVSTTIDKYCYLMCRTLPPFFQHKTRVVYSKIEHVNTWDEIQHPSVRSVLKYLGEDQGVEIHHVGDLPARSGIGSSSAFTVGLVHALMALRGKVISKHELALKSIHIEQKITRENVGSQDQTITSYGGLNHIRFQRTGEIIVEPLPITYERKVELEDHLLLFYLGTSRIASEVAKHFIDSIPEKTRELRVIGSLVDESVGILGGDCDIVYFGKLLHEAFELKKAVSNKVTTPVINEVYETARRAGAIGGKILGAGGGGFLLLFARPSDHAQIRESLSGLLQIPFKFESGGSQIIFNDLGLKSLYSKPLEKQGPLPNETSCFDQDGPGETLYV